MLSRRILPSLFALCLMLSPVLSMGQAVAVNSMVASAPLTSCTNSSVTLSGMLSAANYAYNGASVVVTGNNIVVSVDYLSGLIVLPAFTPFSQTVNLGNLAAGTYNLVGVGTLNGNFQSTMNISITVVSCCAAIPSFTANSTSICPGDSVHLTNTSTGNTSNAWYQNGTFISSGTDVSVPLSTPGAYVFKLVVSDGSCSDSTSQTVTVNLLPVVDLGNDTTICQGTSLSLDPGPLYPGYAWSDGSTNQTLSVNAVGTYTVTVTDGNGCEVEDSISITGLLPNAQVNLGNDTTICPGDSAVLDPGSGWTSYSWSDGSMGNTLTALSSGTYTVTVSAAAQCPGSDSITVFSHFLPVFSLGNDTSVCDTVLLNAGTQFSQFNWSSGQSTSSISVNTSGTYTVTVTDGNGCTQQDDAQVTITGGPTVSLRDDTTICMNFTPTLLIDGTTPGAASYLWSDNSTNPMFVASSINVGLVTFWLQVTDTNGCVGADSVTISFEFCSGIEEEQSEHSFALFPNPGKQQVQLKTDLRGPVELQLLDAQGRLLQKEIRVFSGKVESLNIEGLGSGVYYLRLLQDQQAVVRKLLVD